ncbi:MAG: alpha-ketoglutarate-dependent dioxygenase AlkB [Bacteroidia bacterium]
MNSLTEIHLKDGQLWYAPSFFSDSESDNYLHILGEEIAWRQESVQIFGKKIPQPRLSAWYGDSGKEYTYSGLSWSPLPWTETLMQIKSRIEQAFPGQVYNSVLLNLYRNGKDSMGWHSDDEVSLGKNPVIASVSFGETRQFQMRHKENKKETRFSLSLTHGSLLIMAKETQHYWQHQIPKTARPVASRINLTFRWII